MNATITSPVTKVSPSEQLVRDALANAGFSIRSDGWFYPSGDIDRAAVRVDVFNGQYRIERRRKARSPWMSITAADTAEFDPDSFRVWHHNWPLNF